MRRNVLTLGVVVVLAWSAPARADATAVSAEDEANARFQAGLRHYDAREFESARIAFAQAQAIYPRPALLLNLALSELYAGRPDLAVGHFERYLGTSDVPADKRARATRGLVEARALAARIVVQGASGELALDGAPTVGRALDVLPGHHRLELRAGGELQSRDITTRAGDTVEITFDVEAAAPIRTKLAAPPPSVQPLPPAPATDFWGWRSIGGVGLVGAGAAGIAVGVASTIAQTDAANSVRTLSGALPAPNACTGVSSGSCRELADAVARRDAAASRMVPAYVLGGAALTIGAALLVSAAIWPHAKSRVGLRPTFGPTWASVGVASEF